MQMSNVWQGGNVTFPAFTGERIYMREFTRESGLPADLERWQSTVDAMLEGVSAPGPIFLLVDQAEVRASNTHRRGGVHIDGDWIAEISAHGHRTSPAPRGVESDLLILASDVMGCAAYEGDFSGVPNEGGDFSHLDLSHMTRVEMEPGRVWAGSAMSMLHESVPLPRDCLRTVVRLNVKQGYRGPQA